MTQPVHCAHSTLIPSNWSKRSSEPTGENSQGQRSTINLKRLGDGGGGGGGSSGGGGGSSGKKICLF